MAADNRSAHPNIPGVPWWGAVLIAVVASAAGFAVDAGSGNGELTAVFATLFVLGCLAAVLAVRRNGLFTAVIQPPLILFVVVPGAYFLMHRDSIEGLKDILINCGYPLIERFPLMFFTSAAVLLIGLARWRTGNDIGRAQFRRLRHAPFTFLKHHGILLRWGIEPIGKVNGGGHNQALIGQSVSHIRHRSPTCKAGIKLIVP